MKKLPMILVFTLLFASLFSIFSYAETYANGVYDHADIIDDEAAVNEAIINFEKKCKIPLRIVTTTGDNTYSLDELGFTYNDNLVVLEINSYYDGKFYYDLYTYGDAYTKITDDEVDRILDASDVYDNIKGGRIDEGIIAFASLAATAYTGKLQEAMWVTVLVSAIIAVIIAGTVTGVIIYKYKRKLKAPSYPLERYASMALADGLCSDMFIGSAVTKTRIASSSSGSRSGGGRRSGGGGGHRGGR